MTFIPTRFTTPVVSLSDSSQFSPLPYISPSTYQFAPTAMSTNALVPGSTNPQADSLMSLYERIQSATSWMNSICFQGKPGTYAGTIVTEQDYVRANPNGLLTLMCNYRPVIEMLSLALGPNPQGLQALPSVNGIAISDRQITLPQLSIPMGSNSNFPTHGYGYVGNRVYANWQYVSGYPHTSLAATADAGATTITVNPSSLTNEFAGIDQYTVPFQLTIKDAGNSEQITITAINGLVCTLASPLLYTHTVPTYPNFITVTAIPFALEQAAISLTSVLLKLRGARSQVIPGSIGGAPSATAVAEAGASADLTTAMKLLKDYIIASYRAS